MSILKHIIFFALLFCLHQACHAPEKAKTDTIQSVAPAKTTTSAAANYAGYRLQITDITILQRKKTSVKVRYNLINSGKRAVLLEGTPERIEISFDESLEKNGLQGIQNQLIATVQQKTLYLEPGEMKRNLTGSFPLAADVAPVPIKSHETDPANAPESVSITYCPDLVIDKIEILKQTPKILVVQYTLANVGKGPAALYGKLNDDEDNVYIKAFFSSTEKLSRGAIPVGGDFVTTGVANVSGLLLPNQKYVNIVTFDISEQTPKFTPYMIMEVDAYQKIWECDEKNNIKSAKINAK
jgi:hypothetical protein